MPRSLSHETPEQGLAIRTLVWLAEEPLSGHGMFGCHLYWTCGVGLKRPGQNGTIAEGTGCSQASGRRLQWHGEDSLPVSLSLGNDEQYD